MSLIEIKMYYNIYVYCIPELKTKYIITNKSALIYDYHIKLMMLLCRFSVISYTLKHIVVVDSSHL